MKTIPSFFLGLVVAAGSVTGLAQLKQKLAPAQLKGVFVERQEDGTCSGAVVYRVSPADADLKALVGEQEVAIPTEFRCVDVLSLVRSAVVPDAKAEEFRAAVGLDDIGADVRARQ